MNFYSSRKIEAGICAIEEKHGPKASARRELYLVEGTQKAALIDSGYGLDNSLRQFAENLTDKPIACLLTCVQPDSAGAAALFDEVYISCLDDTNIPDALRASKRLDIVSNETGIDKGTVFYCLDNMIRSESIVYNNIEHGDVIYLGDQKLEVYAIPGLTEGSVAFLDRSRGIIFSGKIISLDVAADLSKGDNSAERLRAYKDSLLRLLNDTEEDIKILTGENAEAKTGAFIKSIAAACDDFLDED